MDGEAKLYTALIAAGVSLLTVVLTAYSTSAREKKKRQNELYGQAYKAVMAWAEMIYRIRRRASSKEAERALIDRFHDIQEQIDFHKGWISIESLWLGRSFDRFIKSVKRKTQPLINYAWDSPIRKSQNSPKSDIHPDLAIECRNFLFDVRCSILPKIFLIPYCILIYRNKYPRKK